MNRRTFLRNMMAGAISAALVNPAAQASSNALSTPDEFRAIVCLYLSGGHDSLNMLVPYDDDAYQAYQAVRPNIAIPKEDLTPLIFNGVNSGYALHPLLPKLAELYHSGELAFIANVGTLVQPTTKIDIESHQATVPPHLFSHNSQADTWLSCQTATHVSKTGWAGRLADNYLESDPQFVIGQTIASSSIWQKGVTQQPYNFGINGVDTFKGFTTKNASETQAVVEALNSLDYQNPLERTFNRINNRAISNSEYANLVLQDPSLNFEANEFPDAHLHDHADLMQKFEMLSKLIMSKDKFSRKRATYYIQDEGYDTHHKQEMVISKLYEALDDSLYAFYTKMKKEGLHESITLFCASDFGRTISTNESGTGHGWGGHYFVLGGSVDGGKVYGKQPDMSPEGDDVVFKTRLLPTTSVEQYAATMTSWLGLSEEQNLELFPNLKNFEQKDLGFMKNSASLIT